MWYRLLIFLMLGVPGWGRAAGPERPHLLFVFADDWGRYASAYARLDPRASINHVIKTPRIDEVAARGVTFRHAFVNSPSCTPCRSALMTGRYFFRTGPGSILHASAWDTTLP